MAAWKAALLACPWEHWYLAAPKVACWAQNSVVRTVSPLVGNSVCLWAAQLVWKKDEWTVERLEKSWVGCSDDS